MSEATTDKISTREKVVIAIVLLTSVAIVAFAVVFPFSTLGGALAFCVGSLVVIVAVSWWTSGIMHEDSSNDTPFS